MSFRFPNDAEQDRSLQIKIFQLHVNAKKVILSHYKLVK